MSRPAKVLINLDALQNNLAVVRSLAPNSKVLAIVKADAYGHGIERVARALHDADGFGVACIEEAQQLRNTGINNKILLLEGPYQSNELKQISDLALDFVVHNHEQLDFIESNTVPMNIWLKVDTGMHRLGFTVDEAKDVLERVHTSGQGGNTIRFMSHLATANEKNNELTGRQQQQFKKMGFAADMERSLANSAAIIASSDSHYDWVRPGLMLYGISPLDNATGTDHGLQVVMTFVSELIAIKNLNQGDAVGYGATWICPENMPVGIVAAGYGDGFPRHAGSGTPILVDGIECQIVGKASMDMLAVDLRNHPGARVGSTVQLWGPDNPVEDLARHAGTVPYEILCGVHKRLHFVEHGNTN